jgi:hypothetical protein
MKDWGFTLNQIIRYGYPGFLVIALFQIVVPEDSIIWFSGMNTIMLMVVGFSIGAFIYIAFRPFLGEEILWRFHLPLHRYLREFWSSREKGRTLNCRLDLLVRQYNISETNALDTFRIIRNELPEYFNKIKLEEQHSEIYILYHTAIVSLPFSFYSCIRYLLTANNTSAKCLDYNVYVIIIPISLILMIISWLIWNICIRNRQIKSLINNRKKTRIKIKKEVVFILIINIVLVGFACCIIPKCEFLYNKDIVVAVVLFSVFLLSLFLGVKADIDLCRIECACLKIIPKFKIENLLRETRK